MRLRTPLVFMSALPLAGLVSASSHREAPFVTEHPKVDATDFYMFTSYAAGRDDYVTLIANYQPLQDPYGGPNYFTMDPEATYRIHVDNDGDSIEDVSFVFRFENRLKQIALQVGAPGAEKSIDVPLRNVGPVSAASAANQNEVERYGLWVIEGPLAAPTAITAIGEVGTGDKLFEKPLDYVGTKSIPAYASYAAAHEFAIQLPDGSEGRVFVGQRKDPFVVNLGEAFDLFNLDPLGPPDAEKSVLDDKNVTSLILEVPKSFLRGSGPVIGGWTAATLPTAQILVEKPTYGLPAIPSPQHTQVSRLGMPLVNELVIGLKDKNKFNQSQPKDDAQFLDYVTHPALPELIEALFPVTAPNAFPRNDLVQVFLTGIPGLNENGAVSEMLRLNLDVPPTPRSAQKSLGVLAGDLAGFPNGRRPGDDVVDAALRVVMGALLDPSVAPSGALAFTDGAAIDAGAFQPKFPYLATPIPGAPN